MTPFLQAVEHIDRALREGHAVSEDKIRALSVLRDDPKAEALIAELLRMSRAQRQ